MSALNHKHMKFFKVNSFEMEFSHLIAEILPLVSHGQ